MLRLLIPLTLLWLSACQAPSAARTPVSYPPEPAFAHAAVAADHPLASQAGLEMLQKGGNAVDAAVAASFCLSVVRPYSCGIGGGGFMLIHIPASDLGPARDIALNYRETAPAAVDKDFYVRIADREHDSTASRFGYRAVGVPGTVAGLCHALQRYGTLDLPTVLAPAIRAAEQGFPADAHFASAASELASTLKEHPELAELAAPVWETLCLKGRVKPGDLITQPDQARALRLIAERGADAFYKGPIGNAIFAIMRTHGGALGISDLKNFTVQETQPLVGKFHGRQILSMPPPSSGGVAMQQIFGILERREADLSKASPNSADYVHLVAEAMKHAFADRSEWLADPNFVDVPVSRLTNPRYLDDLAGRIAMDRTLTPFEYGSIESAERSLPPDSGTSHLCVIDASGMAVACTETINLSYGSLVTVPGYGFTLNDQMDDFTTIPGQANAFGLRQSQRNLPEPGKRPLSSMSPTIVLKDGKPELIAGASGGPRIITATTQCLLDCMVFDMPPAYAVAQPRFHHQWLPDVLQFDKMWTDQRVIADLKKRGHETGPLKDDGHVQMIRIDPDGIRAASDPRKGGAPAGH